VCVCVCMCVCVHVCVCVCVCVCVFTADTFARPATPHTSSDTSVWEALAPRSRIKVYRCLKACKRSQG
jgi:hypothetical protein